MRAAAPTLVLTLLAVVPQQPRPRAASEEVKALVSREYTALAEGNTAALQSLYDEDGQRVFFPIATAKQQGAAAHVQSLEAFRKSVTGLQWKSGADLAVTPIGTTAAMSTISFQMEGALATGQPVSIEGRHTAVWQRAAGQWRIVHEHVSAPWTQPAPTDAAPAENAPQTVALALAAYENAWTAGDATALAALWDEEGDIGTLGSATATKGRTAVTAFWTQTIARRRSASPTVVRASAATARGVSDDVIAADGIFEYRPKNASPAAPAASVDRFALTLHRRAEGWRIASLRIAGGK